MAVMYEYLWVFWRHWWPVFATGAFFGLDEALRAWWPRMTAYLDKVPGWWRRRIAVSAMLLAVFYAGFAAWTEEHTKIAAIIQERDEARGQVRALTGLSSQVDRVLSVEQKEIICREVRKLDEGTFKTTLVASEPSAEPRQYAIELYEHFKYCGAHFANEFKGDAIENAVAISTRNKGFFIVVLDRERPSDAAKTLFGILQVAGFTPQYLSHRSVSQGAQTLWVGPK